MFKNGSVIFAHLLSSPSPKVLVLRKRRRRQNIAALPG
jgi:hypothetical protein